MNACLKLSGSMCLLKHILVLTVVTLSYGQLGSASSFSLGFVNTDEDSSGVDIGVIYEPSLAELAEFGDNYAVVMAPSIEISDGSDGVFSSIILKMTGNVIFFKTKTMESSDSVPGVENIIVPDSSFFTVIPVSIGIETDRSFQNINAIGEIGYIPWYWTTSKESGFLPWLASQSRVAVFLQGGYKFEIDEVSPDDSTTSSSSLEEPNSGLLRVKGSARFEPTLVTLGSFLEVSLFGTGDLWYDALNSELYHRTTGGLRLTVFKQTWIALKYESGSGAPLFLEGDQIGVDLGVSL